MRTLYEHLWPVEPGALRPDCVDAPSWPRLLAVAGEVHRRTGARCWVDVMAAQYVFGYRLPDGRVALIGLPNLYVKRGMVPLKLPDGRLTEVGNRSDVQAVFDAAMDDYSVDDVCYLIQLGRVDRRRKARWEATRKMRIRHEAAERWHRETGDLLRRAMDEGAERVKLALVGSKFGRRVRERRVLL